MNSSSRFGLIGNPVKGSGSPALFARAYGGRWPYDLIEGACFEASWERFLSGYRAINITAPFKEPAFLRVQSEGILAPECEAIGAINIAVKAPEGIRGFNSDYLGVKALLSGKGYGPGSVAVVAGFGGAGKAAAAAARSLGMDVVVCNRSRKADGIRPLEDLPALCGICDILICTLPTAVPQLEGLHFPAILEADYRNPCLEHAADNYIPGTEWLLEQARTGYALMTGETPFGL